MTTLITGFYIIRLHFTHALLKSRRAAGGTCRSGLKRMSSLDLQIDHCDSWWKDVEIVALNAG